MFDFVKFLKNPRNLFLKSANFLFVFVLCNVYKEEMFDWNSQVINWFANLTVLKQKLFANFSDPVWFSKEWLYFFLSERPSSLFKKDSLFSVYIIYISVPLKEERENFKIGKFEMWIKYQF